MAGTITTKEQLLDRQRTLLAARNFASDVRNIERHDYNPVKSDWGDEKMGILETGLYGVPGALASTVLVSIPFVGAPAMFSSMEGAAYDDIRRNLMASGMTDADATARASEWATVAALPQAALEKLQAAALVGSGARELLVISQDTSAYGVDLGHPVSTLGGLTLRAHITDLARELGGLGAWVRLHYVYPYPHVRDLVPLMAEGLILPYLDIPFQHAHPETLRRMARPAAAARTLDEIAAWRATCPDITLRSTFIVGYPGETEEEFQTLLDWMDAAQLDRVGCFQYENVAGARSNALPDHVPAEVKQERRDRFMEKAQSISAARLEARVGSVIEVIVDEVDGEGATCRTRADAPEIDGNLFIDEGFEGLTPGDLVTVRVDEAGAYDLWGTRHGA
jgi:hypothetical protein